MHQSSAPPAYSNPQRFCARCCRLRLPHNPARRSHHPRPIWRQTPQCSQNLPEIKEMTPGGLPNHCSHRGSLHFVVGFRHRCNLSFHGFGILASLRSLFFGSPLCLYHNRRWPSLQDGMFHKGLQPVSCKWENLFTGRNFSLTAVKEYVTINLLSG